jgi:signal transduction histidine kinase
MSGHRRARTRLIAAAMLGIAAALAAFAVVITVRYRDGLEQRLRTDLTSGASAIRAAGTPGALKSVIGSLAAQGISVDLAGITGPGGSLQITRGASLLIVHELIPVAGRDVAATLTGSLAGIDRQVRSLEVTEAIGGVIALALLAALARALVLLDRAALDARASEAAMRTFLGDASHELRTPVAALQATAERLLRDQPARPARDAIEAQLARDSGRLGHLIDDLLSLARLDARERPHRQPVDLADLAAAAVAATRTTDAAARVKLITTGPVPATGDRDSLLRAIRNLLDNAIAVADTVVVEVTQAANGPSVSVTDDGPGVPADQRERIFEPFVRLPQSPRGGTGLGLAIVRRTIESHGGTVTCDPSPAGGARFTLRVPADSEPAGTTVNRSPSHRTTTRTIAAAKALVDRLTRESPPAPPS